MAEYHLVNADGKEWHGFKSRLAAWKYVLQCSDCQNSIDNLTIKYVSYTTCAAEYLVLSDREYKEYHDPPFTCWEHKDRVMSRYWAKKKRSRRPRR